MKLRTLAFAALVAVAGIGASQAGGYGHVYRGYGYVAPAYGGYAAPVCTVVQKRNWVYGYGWVYRDIRICR